MVFPVTEMVFKVGTNGDKAKTKIKIEFPNGDAVEMDCIIRTSGQ